MQPVAALVSAPAAPPTRPPLVFQVISGSHASLTPRNMSDLLQLGQGMGLADNVVPCIVVNGVWNPYCR